MKKILFFLALSLTTITALWAQTGELVRDINLTSPESGLSVHEMVSGGSKVYFTAQIGNDPVNLWKSDGTEAGTQIVKEFTQTATMGEPKWLTYAKNALYFIAPFNGDYWLYKSDGTAAGTIPFFRTNARAYADGANIIQISNFILFAGYDATNGLELWRTDGTPAGTSLVKNIRTGAQSSNPTGFTSYKTFYEDVYFYTSTGTTPESYELWKSNGTDSGTMMVASVGTAKVPLAITSGYLYYAVYQSQSGDFPVFALYRTNGNVPGTLVKNQLINLNNLTGVGYTLFFAAVNGTSGTELWKSDGSTAGTVLVEDINTGPGASSDPGLLTNVNGLLFFSATIGSNDRQIWRSDGTAAGTYALGDFHTGSDDLIEVIFNFKGTAVFTGYSNTGWKVWRSDGTVAGTKTFANFEGRLFVNVGGSTLYFVGQPPKGPQLYTSFLTEVSTKQITYISDSGSRPRHITDVNGTGYFSAINATNGRELWKTNATTAGTVLVKDINTGAGNSNPELLTNVNGILYFVADNGVNGRELWKSDGTAAGTVLVKDVVSAPTDSIKGLINVNGTLLFSVRSTSGSMQLWKSDGTAAGTSMIKTFTSAPAFAPVILNGQVYFFAWDGISNSGLWKSDGTSAGTVSTGVISTNRISHTLVSDNNYLYYITGVDYEHYSLVKSNGTAAGTTVLKELYPENYAVFSKLTAVNNLVFFTALALGQGDDLPAEYLWRTDGTAAGTIELKRFGALTEDYTYTHDQVVVNNTFYFVPPPYNNNEFGEQLWKSDGTAAGTQLVKHFEPVASVGYISHAVAVGNLLYFKAADVSNGAEVWRSNGTTAGTYLAYDINPNGSSYFEELANVNGILLISADASAIGGELYKIQGPAGLGINSGGTAFAASGSRQFIADQYFSGTTQISTALPRDILNTTDDQLYKEQRVGSTFSYNIPVTNGQVNVVLHFAEIYWGIPGRGGSAGSGKRRFNVDMEGIRKLTNYDIFAAAGGAMRARTEIISVTVSDGMLNLNFLTGAADKPAIAAIEVFPAQQLSRGPIADSYIRNFPYDAGNNGFSDVLGIKTGSLPSYQRNTYLKFSLAGIAQVSSAKLRVYARNTQDNTSVTLAAFGVTDDSWAEYGIIWLNAPAPSGGTLGSVMVNATAKYYEIDVTAFVQAQLAGDRIVSLFLTNPTNQNIQLNINSRENTANPPQLLIQTTPAPGVRMGVENDIAAVSPEKAASRIYPNPAGQRFTIDISDAHKGNVSLQLTSQAGNSYQIGQSGKAEGASKMEVDISSMNLSKGLYLLKIQSTALTEVVKVLVLDQ